jgi:thymidylate synthase (FAD)
MKIIKPSVEIIDKIVPEEVIKKIELCGRVCYKSEDRITAESGTKFIMNLIKRGHESVLEHASFTVKFICDRGVTHEMVRHRIASFSQESTRYCNYAKGGFGSEITVIEPCYLAGAGYGRWEMACRQAERAYFDLLNWGCTVQEARAVLPNSLKTEIIMTANLREWRHFLKLMTSPAAHPQMREVADMLLEQVNFILPVFFDDIIL